MAGVDFYYSPTSSAANFFMALRGARDEICVDSLHGGTMARKVQKLEVSANGHMGWRIPFGVLPKGAVVPCAAFWTLRGPHGKGQPLPQKFLCSPAEPGQDQRKNMFHVSCRCAAQSHKAVYFLHSPAGILLVICSRLVFTSHTSGLVVGHISFMTPPKCPGLEHFMSEREKSKYEIKPVSQGRPITAYLVAFGAISHWWPGKQGDRRRL